VTLVLQGLTVRHQGQQQPALADLSLTVAEGSLTAVLGPSGAGKSTLLRLIAGHMAPDRGEVLLNGQSILGLPPDRRGVVLVFQNAPLFPHLTLAENVGFGLRMRGLPRAIIAARAAEMLEKVQLQGLGARRPSQLSGGQAQRGALARALILQPRLLLLDEPLSNLDPSLREEMGALIRQLQRDSGVTTLVVTHDRAEAVALADRIALILDGRLAQEALPEDIFARPATLTVARFFGGANFLPGRATGDAFDCALGRIPLPPGCPQGMGHLTIRPEALRLEPGPDTLLAEVTELAFLGTQTRVGLALAGQQLMALIPPEAARGLTPGASVPVTLPRQALWVIPDSSD
jgi:ABC-type Fe3+/spermidine/putrescine transport system ATPase subunit